MTDQSNLPVMAGAAEPFYQTWMKALTRPSEQTFAAMAASPNAKASTAYLWYFLAALVSFFLTSLVQGALMRQMIQDLGDSGQFDSGGVGGGLIGVVCGAPIGAAISTLFFGIIVAVVQWIAKMFGGKGTADQLAYTLAAILAPYSIVAGLLALLGAIPTVGFCFGLVSLGFLAYVIVLEVMAVKGVNQFGWGEAIGSLFIPILAVALLCACLVGAVFMLAGPAIGDVFSQINQSLQNAP
ncbi:MAG TPA: YIP1 family protein [Anaerolineales bacterium]|jgi:hypothetical protein